MQSTAPSMASALIERCEALGVAAWTFDAGGAMSGCTQQASALGRMLCARVILDVVRGVVTSGGAKSEIAGVLPQAILRVFALGRERWDGVGIAMAPLAGFEDTDVYHAMCREAGVDAVEAKSIATALGKFDEASARVVLKAVVLGCQDRAELNESRRTIDGFASQLSESFDTIDVLYNIGAAMRDLARPEQFFRSMCERLHAALNFEWITARFSPTAGREVGRAGLDDAVFGAGKPPREEATAGRRLIASMESGSGTRVLDSASGLSQPERPQVLVAPLDRGSNVLAALMAGGKHGNDLAVSSGDIQLLEAATGFMGAFLDNVALFEEQRRMFMGTLHALTAAIDAKDRYTRGHSERVAYIAEQIALQIKLPAEQVERVRIAGLVHDVGKIGVPEAVLTKAGKLDDAEFELIKQHPAIGHRIVRDIPQFADVLPGVLHHHERWDGRGYPSKLAGEDIPLWARIIAIADTFDAMSSTRSYRPAMERPRVLAEMQRCAGSQFDPSLVPAFLRIDLAVYDEMAKRHAGTDTPAPPQAPAAKAA